MAGPPQVLVVGHDASRTGAPGLGLRWVRWAGETGLARPAVWLDRGGPLVAAFEAAAPTQVARWAAPLGRLVPVRHPLDRAPFVLANTVAAWATAASVRKRTQLVVWVHELDHVADRIVRPAQRTALLAETDHLIAEGDRVAAMLVQRWHVDPGRITVVPSFADPAGAPPAAPGPGRPDVVAIGSMSPRKGPDAFVAVLGALLPAHPELRAAWVGGPTTSDAADLVRHDLAAAGLGDHVRLVGEVDDATAWLAPGTILLHPAREDPDPVAVVEAALRGVAVVTWDTGGAADLLRSAGLGHLVAPAGDVLGLARRVDDLLRDPSARQAAGQALQQAAARRTTEHAAPLILDAVVGRAR
ncbi:MAG: glycosyl transferase family 1 [Ilumatobacteraceae bacterium]|nr:glycosyl transferase family 1 [Ilumatobacteraceae bacterium]